MPLFVGRCASEVPHSVISVEVGTGEPHSSKDTRFINELETREASENGHVGIGTSSPKKAV